MIPVGKLRRRASCAERHVWDEAKASARSVLGCISLWRGPYCRAVITLPWSVLEHGHHFGVVCAVRDPLLTFAVPRDAPQAQKTDTGVRS